MGCSGKTVRRVSDEMRCCMGMPAMSDCWRSEMDAGGVVGCG